MDIIQIKNVLKDSNLVISVSEEACKMIDSDRTHLNNLFEQEKSCSLKSRLPRFMTEYIMDILAGVFNDNTVLESVRQDTYKRIYTVLGGTNPECQIYD